MQYTRTIITVFIMLLLSGGVVALLTEQFPERMPGNAMAQVPVATATAQEAVEKVNDFSAPDSFTIQGETFTLQDLQANIPTEILVPDLSKINLPPFPNLTNLPEAQQEQLANEWMQQVEAIMAGMETAPAASENVQLPQKSVAVAVPQGGYQQLFQQAKNFSQQTLDMQIPLEGELKEEFINAQRTSFDSPQTLRDAQILLQTASGLLALQAADQEKKDIVGSGLLQGLNDFTPARLNNAVSAINQMQPADLSKVAASGNVSLLDLIQQSNNGDLRRLGSTLQSLPGAAEALSAVGGVSALNNALGNLNLGNTPAASFATGGGPLSNTPSGNLVTAPGNGGNGGGGGGGGNGGGGGGGLTDPRDNKCVSKKVGKFYTPLCCGNQPGVPGCAILPDVILGPDHRYRDAALEGIVPIKESWPADLLGTADVIEGVQGAKPFINSASSMSMLNTEKLIPLNMNKEPPTECDSGTPVGCNAKNPNASWLYESACITRLTGTGFEDAKEYEDDTQLYRHAGMGHRDMTDIFEGVFACNKIYPTQVTGCFGDLAGNDASPYYIAPKPPIPQLTPNCPPAIWIRLMTDSCTNQYLAPRAFLPLVNPLDDSGAQIGMTERFCQPLRRIPVSGESAKEYRADHYLRYTFDNVLKHDYYPGFKYEPEDAIHYRPDRPNRPIMEYNPTGSGTSSQKMIQGLDKSFTLEMAKLGPGGATVVPAFNAAHQAPLPGGGTVNLMASFPYERIFDVYHPFSPRYDFRFNDREKYSPKTFMGSGLTNLIPFKAYDEMGDCTVRCAAQPVDILRFRADKFDECISCRIKANASCLWGEIMELHYIAWTCRAKDNNASNYQGWPNIYRGLGPRWGGPRWWPPSPGTPGYWACTWWNIQKYRNLKTATTAVLNDDNPMSSWSDWKRASVGYYADPFWWTMRGAWGLTGYGFAPDCKTNRSKEKQWPMCSTKFDIEDAEEATSACSNCKSIKDCCHELAQPLAGINMLKIRSDAEQNMPEGYTFREYFGNHRPYMRWWDTGKEAGMGLRPRPDYHCDLGHMDTIIGVGREPRYTYSLTGDIQLQVDPVTGEGRGESCRIGGGGGAGFGCIPSYQVGTENNPVPRGPNSLTGWTELKLYQTRCIQRHNSNCICQYEKLFKPGGPEDAALLAAGGQYQSLWRSYVPDAAGNIIEGALQSKGLSYPFSWRGYVADPDNNKRFPFNLAASKNSLISSGSMLVGLDNAKKGDILIWDMTMPIDTSIGQYEQIPHVAVVTEAYNEASGRRTDIIGGSRDAFVRVVDFNHGKLPDACGTTEMWHMGTPRTIRKNKPGDDISMKVGGISFDRPRAMRGTISCIDPDLSDCLDPSWDDVLVYRVWEDVRNPCPVLAGKTYSDTKALNVLPLNAPADMLRPIDDCIAKGFDPDPILKAASGVAERLPSLQQQGRCSPSMGDAIPDPTLILEGAMSAGCPAFNKAINTIMNPTNRKIIELGVPIDTSDISSQIPTNGKIEKLPCGGGINLVNIVGVSLGKNVRVLDVDNAKQAVSSLFTTLIADVLQGVTNGICPNNFIGRLLKEALTVVLNTYPITSLENEGSSLYAYIRPESGSNVFMPPWGGVEIDVQAGGGSVTLPMGGSFMSASGEVVLDDTVTVTVHESGDVFLSDGRVFQVAQHQPLQIDTDAVITPVSYKKHHAYSGDGRITVRNNVLVAPAFGSAMVLPERARIEIDVAGGGGTISLPYGGEFKDINGMSVLVRTPATLHVDSRGNGVLSDGRRFRVSDRVPFAIKTSVVTVPPGTGIPLPKNAEVVQPEPYKYYIYE